MFKVIKVNFYLNTPNLDKKAKELIKKFGKDSKEFKKHFETLDSTILVKFQYKKQSITTSINTNIHKSFWNAKKQRPKENYEFANKLTEYLNELEKIIKTHLTNNPNLEISEVYSFLRNTINPKIETTELQTNLLELFVLFIKESKESKRKSKKLTTISNNTLKTYLTTYKHLELFLKTNSLMNIKPSEFTKEILNSFIDYIQSKGISNNSLKLFLTIIKTFFKYLESKEIETNKKLFANISIPTNESNLIALNINELNLLKNVELKERSLNHIRNLFIIQCYIGLRFSDLVELKKENFDFENKVIRLATKKTKSILTIPINDYVIDLCNSINYDFNRFSLIHYDKKIKEIGKLAGINKLEQTNKQIDNTMNSSIIEKWNLLSSHVARRTFITINLKKGILAESIMKITGHKNRNSFNKYVKVGENDSIELIRKTQNEI